jgi:hypothetical protein
MAIRAVWTLAAALLALSVAGAQDKDKPQDPPKNPNEKGGQDHELHVRPFGEIWKDIELKQKESKSYKAQIAVAISDQYADQTTWYKGELFVKREEKQPPLLFWKVGIEKRDSSGGTGEITVQQRSYHDGAQVTVTDESDPKDLRFWKDSPQTEVKFMPQEILLTGGKDLDKAWEVRTLKDPKLQKKDRTISKHLDDNLENKEGSDPTKIPKAENVVDSYAFELKPKSEELKRQVVRLMLTLDSVSLQPAMIAVEFVDGNRMQVTVTNVVKLDPKDITEKKIFDFQLSDQFKAAQD